jgi:hypothetical protein
MKIFFSVVSRLFQAELSVYVTNALISSQAPYFYCFRCTQTSLLFVPVTAA